MSQINRVFLDLSEAAHTEADEKANSLCRRWRRLSERYLPVKTEDSIWKFSRDRKRTEPLQGWKLHISATILQACDVFERVAPFLTLQDVQFKAPKSLDELSKINCGLQYGYSQVGKFITVYSSSQEQAVRLAERIHELTSEFVSISVPFDEQYLPDSSVFYRYGAFASMEMIGKNNRTFPAIKSPTGEFVQDDRFRAVPEWIPNLFQNDGKNFKKTPENAETPLKTTYKIFRAVTQRGKGGTYKGLDFSVNPPRLCILKEGRRHGEVMWNSQDGYCLVKNEFDVLSALRKSRIDVPQVFSSFELSGNFYLAMEYVEGKSLHDLLRTRRRRFSVKQVLTFAVEIAKIIEKIHKAGWVWNDCKPANLIVTHRKTLKPIDFEGSYPANRSDPFDWKTQGFSKPANNQSLAKKGGKSDDLYAFGLVVYFLLTGRFYNADEPIAIGKLRRNVPQRLIKITEKLLSDSALERQSNVSEARKEFESILNLI